MTQTSSRLYSYEYSDVRTYIAALLFVAGNIILPQLCHILPHGGMTWLPIYFFTLVGSFKYGWRVGLLTALASPLANHALFGMPMLNVLPAILTKSVLLALAAGFAAQHFKHTSRGVMLGIVAFYQLLGSVAEFFYTGSAMAALQDVRMGIPGMLVQVIGGHLFIKHLMRK